MPRESNQRSLRAGKDTKKNLYPCTVEQEERVLLYNRFGIVRKYINKVSRDVVGNWHEIDTTNDRLRTALETMAQKRNLQYHCGFAHELAMRDGYALLFLDWDDSNDLSRPVQWAQATLRDISVHPGSACKVVQDEKTHEITHYTINGFGTGQKEYNIHPDRIIRWVHEEDATTPKGVSVIDCNYNVLLSLQNAVWGVGQTIFRYGSGFPILYFENIPDNQKDDIKDAFEESHAWVSMAIDKNHGAVDFAGAKSKALDPEPYITILMDQICAGWNIPKTVLLGSQAGAVTGAEFNWKDYYSDINSVQRAAVEPRILDIYNRFLLSEGFAPEELNYELEWNPQVEMEEGKRAEMLKLKAEAAVNLMAAGRTANEVAELLDLPKHRQDFQLIGGQLVPVGPNALDNAVVTNAQTVEEKIFDIFAPPDALLDLQSEEFAKDAAHVLDDVLEEFRNAD